MKRFLIIAFISSLAAACSANQVSQIATDVGAITPALTAACSAAMVLAPIAGPIAPFILAGCGTADAIAKLASDPSSLTWVQGLISEVQSLQAVKAYN